MQGNEVRQLVVQNPGLIIWRGTPHDITRKEGGGAFCVLVVSHPCNPEFWNLMLYRRSRNDLFRISDPFLQCIPDPELASDPTPKKVKQNVEKF
jgi:hypothetical protein